MVSKRDKNFKELIEFLKTCENGKISKKELEKAIFKYAGTIDPRSQKNTVKKLLLGNYIKYLNKATKVYMIMV